ncbi:Stage V sporulation protein K [Thermotalea metallivorans]|uniref:Stage V sporulation protein K n=2 Tax=Thermotalea metallivorans TaxID=520762 RepID=A0A140L0B8_9FIRM|nr:Stage V sporulation protein K [Thermotalea metallivorans]
MFVFHFYDFLISLLFLGINMGTLYYYINYNTRPEGGMLHFFTNMLIVLANLYFSERFLAEIQFKTSRKKIEFLWSTFFASLYSLIFLGVLFYFMKEKYLEQIIAINDFIVAKVRSGSIWTMIKGSFSLTKHIFLLLPHMFFIKYWFSSFINNTKTLTYVKNTTSLLKTPRPWNEELGIMLFRNFPSYRCSKFFIGDKSVFETADDKKQDEILSQIRKPANDEDDFFGSKPKKKYYEEGLKELNNLIGLETLKEEIKIFLANMEMMKKKKKAGLKQDKGTLHMLFLGNAGTSKTTVARIMAKLLYGLGYISENKLVEADRESLIAQYVGHTAIKTKELIQRAKGGVLFIDEAYSLKPKSNGFEQEAIDTLVKMMEDEREDLVIIFAGYEKEMEEFLQSNSGLKSRIPYTFHFPNYSKKELVAIAKRMLKNKKYNLTANAALELEKQIDRLLERAKHENGRLIRNLVERIEKEQNLRLYKTNEKDLAVIIEEDIIKAVDFVVKQ